MVTSSTGYDSGKSFTSVKKIVEESSWGHLAKIKFDDDRKLGHPSFGIKKSVLFVMSDCSGEHIVLG